MITEAPRLRTTQKPTRKDTQSTRSIDPRTSTLTTSWNSSTHQMHAIDTSKMEFSSYSTTPLVRSSSSKKNLSELLITDYNVIIIISTEFLIQMGTETRKGLRDFDVVRYFIIDRKRKTNLFIVLFRVGRNSFLMAEERGNWHNHTTL